MEFDGAFTYTDSVDYGRRDCADTLEKGYLCRPCHISEGIRSDVGILEDPVN
jgi:hypothetical protein